jgi:hypothetical protein
MNTNNPTGLPNVVLGGEAHMKALADSFDTILNNVKVTAEVKAAKQAELDDSLIPPEVDWDSIYYKDQDYIQGLLKEYSDTAVGYWEKGVNHLNPSSGSVYKEMRDKENKLLQAVAQSAQDKKMDENVVTTMTKKGFGDVYDLPETLNRLSSFRDAPLSERRKLLEQSGGFYQEKPFDWNTFTTDNMPSKPDMYVEDKKTKGGYTEWTQTTGYTEQTAINTAKGWLKNPGYQKHVAGEIMNLSAATQVEMATKAVDAGLSIEEYYAKMDFDKKQFKQSEPHYAKTANAPKGGNGNNNPKEPQTFDLAVRVSAMWRGDTAFYPETVTLNGRTYQKADFPVTKFGTFKNVNPDKNKGGGLTIGPNGSLVVGGGSDNNVSANYLEGVIRDPKTGEVLITTTELNENTIGTLQSDGKYYIKATDRFWTEFLNGAVNGQEYSKTILDKFVQTTGALKANGDYDFNKFYTPESLRQQNDDTPDNLKKKN